MKIERTRNASRNIIWGIFERMIGVLLPFITRTILIKVLGAEYLGLNSLFTSILQVLSISELGIGTAIVFSMYRPIAEDDNETLCALLNMYRKIYSAIGLIILFAGMAILPFLPRLISGECPAGINVYILYFVYLFNTVISYFLYAYKQAIFSAYQRNDLISKRTAIVSFGSNLLQIGVLLTLKNYYAYVLIIPLATIGTNILNAILANKMFPELKCSGEVSKQTKQDIKKRIIGLMSFKIYNVIFTSVDTIVISSFLGLRPLAIYNNYYYVQSAIIGFLNILTASITAGVGNKMITNDVEENYYDFKKFTFANGWICSWCAVCLVCLYQHFMKCWVGIELVFPFHTMLLMVFYFLLPRITTMTYTYREAAGLWWEDRIRPLVATAVNLSVNIFLVRIIGMDGVIISTLICTIFINVPWGSMVLFKHYFKRKPYEYFGQLLYYITITAISCGATLGICSLLSENGWSFLFVKGVICCVIPNLIFLLFYHRMREFAYMKGLFFKIARKFVR